MKEQAKEKDAFKELFDRINCDTGLIFVDTPEETRLIREIYRQYSAHDVEFWSAGFGLHKIDSNITDDINSFIPHQYNPSNSRTSKDKKVASTDIIGVCSVIEQDCRSRIDPSQKIKNRTIYILRDADKFLANPIVLRTLRDLIYLAACSLSTIIVTGHGITIPNDLSKDSVFIKLTYPMHTEIESKIIPSLKTNITLHNKRNISKDKKIDPEFNEEEVIRACMGLTEDQIVNVLQYTTTVDNKVNTARILEEKRQIINKSDILQYWICDSSLGDVGGFGNLKDWFGIRKVVMTSPNAEAFGAKPPKGIMLLGVQGSGKAMPLYTKILMEDKTFKELSSIEVGDVVRTPNGKTAKIINIFEHKNKDNFKITFVDGRTIECCDEHLWKIYNKNFKSPSNLDGWKIVETKEVARLLEQKDDTRRCYIPLVIDSQDTIDLPIDPYILGVLLGDDSFRYNVQFSSNDQEIVDKVSARLTDGYHIHSYNTHSVREHRIARNENDGHLANIYKQELIKLGLWGLTPKEKFIPEYYFTASLHQKISLLQGLIDTDGSTDLSLNVSTSSKKLAEDIQRLVWSIGGICTISNIITICEGKSFPSFRVDIRYRDPKELVYITRKKDKLSNNYQYTDLKLEIDSIEYIGKENMRCIMLDDNECLYIVDNYIVTHNTFIAKSVAADLGMGLIKLDMGKVFAGVVGESEKRMRMALEQIEAAGGVVIVDEIDKGLSGAGSSDKSDGGTTSRVIGTLLTWLQEPHPGVFLIATANDISRLIANHSELLRKGRFDEIWFSDLPTVEERKQIFDIHLKKIKRDVSRFDLDRLANIMYYDADTGKYFGYTGAEIEYAIIDSVQDAFARGGGKSLVINGPDDITTEMLETKLKLIKPIAFIGQEPIQKMRRWASQNARNVSSITIEAIEEKTPTKISNRAINLRNAKLDI